MHCCTTPRVNLNVNCGLGIIVHSNNKKKKINWLIQIYCKIFRTKGRGNHRTQEEELSAQGTSGRAWRQSWMDSPGWLLTLTTVILARLTNWFKVLGRTSWWLPLGYVLTLRSPSERSFKWTPKLIPTQSQAPRGSAAYTMRETTAHLAALQPILQTTESILPLEASNRCWTFIGEGSLSTAGDPETRNLKSFPEDTQNSLGFLSQLNPRYPELGILSHHSLFVPCWVLQT